MVPSSSRQVVNDWRWFLGTQSQELPPSFGKTYRLAEKHLPAAKELTYYQDYLDHYAPETLWQVGVNDIPEWH
jgi:hypothetical protein